MKLNKPIITICIIILLVVDLIFFSFLFIGKKLSNNSFIKDTIQEFDFKEYLLDDEVIADSINNFKYPKEVFDYLDNNKINKAKKEFANLLIKKEEQLINKEEIKDILDSSVFEYEYRSSSDTYSFVEEDIDYFSNKMEKDFNTNFVNEYYSVNKLSSGILYYISLILIITGLVFIIILEQRNGFLISSIILIIYSFLTYYINKNMFEFGFNSVFKYFKKINLQMDNLYMICFILGFVLLLIYIVKSLRKMTREIRIKSYYRR